MRQGVDSGRNQVQEDEVAVVATPRKQPDVSSDVVDVSELQRDCEREGVLAMRAQPMEDAEPVERNWRQRAAAAAVAASAEPAVGWQFECWKGGAALAAAAATAAAENDCRLGGVTSVVDLFSRNQPNDEGGEGEGGERVRDTVEN